MADNYSVKNAAGTTFSRGAKDVSSVWYSQVIVVDPTATYTLPTMDASARKGFVALTDGTDTAGIDDVDGALDERANVWVQTASALMALDAGASAGSQTVPLQVESTAQPNLRVAVLNAGNQMPAGDAVGRRVYTQHTDGTNSTPAGDALARPLFVRLSDGTAALAPAAAAMADALANPTTTKIGVLLQKLNGATWDRLRVANVFKDVSAVTITTITTVWTPASGKKFRLMGGVLSASAAMNVLFEDNAAGAGNFVFRTPKLLADTPFVFTLGENGVLSATADQVLKATGSAAGAITGTLFGVEE